MSKFLLVAICLGTLATTLAQQPDLSNFSEKAKQCMTNCRASLPINFKGSSVNEMKANFCKMWNKAMECVGGCESASSLKDIVRSTLPEDNKAMIKDCDGNNGGLVLVPGVGVVVALMASLGMAVIVRM